MGSLISSLGLAYLAGSGLCTNAAIVGRGLFRVTRTAVEGNFQAAGGRSVGRIGESGTHELRLDRQPGGRGAGLR